MHASIEVVVDGQPVAGGFYERLVSASVVDKEGVTSDTCQLELNDGPPSFLALPRKGAIIDIRMGYRPGALRSLGQFVVDKVSGACLPYSLTISGKSADLRSGKLKENQERHWDDKTVKQIVEDIAKDAGLEAKVDGDIGAFQYDWFGQEDETGIHMLRRLERRHNGLFSVKNGQLIFARRGSGQSASGVDLGTIILTPPKIIEGTCTFELNDRSSHSKVVAYHQDRDKAERVEVEAPIEGAESGTTFRIGEPLASKDEAQKTADAKAKELKRAESLTSVATPGDTSIGAGVALVYTGVRPELDGIRFQIDTATHTYSKTEGYRTAISATVHDGSAGGGGAQRNIDAAAA